MSETFHIVGEAEHNRLVEAVYLKRGYNEAEAKTAAVLAARATRHGIRTHNALKALHLDHLFGSGKGGCVPGARVEKLPGRFAASEVWNAHRKLGQEVAREAMEKAMGLADRFGIGQVSVDNAFHYLWGGGYVMEAADRGYIAYTNCTSTLAEVVPFGGKFPTLGTNPHSWGFPTRAAVGFPIVIDWATSVVAMGRVQQLAREGKALPPAAAVDKEGNPTTDPKKAAALLPFGAHKGYGLSLINELMGGFIGGSLPTIRGLGSQQAEAAARGEKFDSCFYFQVIHPEALSGGAFVAGRDQAQNVRAVLADILGHGNEGCMLPGQVEAEAAARCERAGGLLFSTAEVEAFGELAVEAGLEPWKPADLPVLAM